MLALALELYILKLVYYSESKECLEVIKTYQTYSHDSYFEITELARRFFQKLSSSRIYYCYIVLRNVEGQKKKNALYSSLRIPNPSLHGDP